MKKTFITLAEKSSDWGYSVFVPDIEGSFSQGKTLEEAKENITEALQEFIDVMVDDGDDIPTPRDYQALEKEYPASRYAPIFVNVLIKGKKKKYTVTLDADIVDQIKSEHGNLSGFLEESAKIRLEHLS